MSFRQHPPTAWRLLRMPSCPRLVGTGIVCAAVVLAVPAAGYARVEFRKPATVERNHLTFRLHGVTPASVVRGSLVRGSRKRRLNLRALRAAARRGALRVPRGSGPVPRLRLVLQSRPRTEPIVGDSPFVVELPLQEPLSSHASSLAAAPPQEEEPAPSASPEPRPEAPPASEPQPLEPPPTEPPPTELPLAAPPAPVEEPPTVADPAPIEPLPESPVLTEEPAPSDPLPTEEPTPQQPPPTEPAPEEPLAQEVVLEAPTPPPPPPPEGAPEAPTEGEATPPAPPPPPPEGFWTPFADGFSGPDGVLTNHHAYWDPDDETAIRSDAWEVESGCAYRQQNTLWTGIPSAVEPDRECSNGSGSEVFRLWTKRTDFASVSVTMSLRNNGYVAGTTSGERSWDGIKLWLRRQGRSGLVGMYLAEVNRRQGNILIQKKCPGAEDYVIVGQNRPAGAAATIGAWETVGGTIRNLPGGGVHLSVIRHGRTVLEATDTGDGCPPLTDPGRVGIRGDNADFNVDDFVVNRLP